MTINQQAFNYIKEKFTTKQQATDYFLQISELALNANSNIIETAAVFLACGLDPKKNVIFCQSSVAGHSELAWIFNCVARIGWLNRMTQFKEKSSKDILFKRFLKNFLGTA